MEITVSGNLRFGSHMQDFFKTNELFHTLSKIKSKTVQTFQKKRGEGFGALFPFIWVEGSNGNF